MKGLVYIVFFFGWVAQAQVPYSNRPEITVPIIERFIQNATIRGIEVKERMATIDSIMVVEIDAIVAGDHTPHSWGYCTIRLRSSDMGDEFKRTRRLYHELGHHFGIKDCDRCKYGIMSSNGGDRASYLFKDEYLRMLYIDMYFEAIRNPKNYNEGHTHY